MQGFALTRIEPTARCGLTEEWDSVPVAMRVSALRQTGRPLEPPPTERQRRKVAERVGFEPTVEFPLHTLSKRAPSTTRTSLHVRSTTCERSNKFSATRCVRNLMASD